MTTETTTTTAVISCSGIDTVSLLVTVLPILLIGIIVLIVLLIKNAKKKKEKKKEEYENGLKQLCNGLSYVKVLGTRSAVNTHGSININSTLYSLLFVYADGHQTTREIDQDKVHYFEAYIKT